MSEERLSEVLAKHDYGTHSIADDHDVFIPVARRVLEPIPESVVSEAAHIIGDAWTIRSKRVLEAYRQYLLNGESV